MGTVFKITLGGKLTAVYSFALKTTVTTAHTHPGADPGHQWDFLRNNRYGGPYNLGTIFSLSVNLGPLWELQETSGKVEVAVKILGMTDGRDQRHV